MKAKNATDQPNFVALQQPNRSMMEIGLCERRLRGVLEFVILHVIATV